MNRRKKACLVFTLFSFLCLPALRAADYWVDAKHPKASDENAGTKEAPWKTIQHSASTNAIKPGDTVHIMPGRYPEQVVMKASGRSEYEEAAVKARKGAPPAPITFIADGNGPAVIDGAERLTAGNLTPSGTRGVFAWKPPEKLTLYRAGGKSDAMAWVFLGDQRLILRHPCKLSADEIKDWGRLCRELVSGKSEEARGPARRVWTLLFPETQPESTNYIDAARQAIEAGAKGQALQEEEKQVILNRLNNLIDRREIFEKEAFAGVQLPKEAADLLDDKQLRNAWAYPHKMPRLNRLLMEVSFPEVIARRSAPLSTADRMCFARMPEQVLVNLDGNDIPTDANLEVSCRMYGFGLTDMQNIHIKGIEFHRQIGQAINLNTCKNCVVEDCNIVQPNMHGIATPGSENCAFRRVRISGANMWAGNFFGQGHTIEECVFQTCGWRLDPAGEPWVGILKFNSGSFHTVRHNLVMDRPPSKWKLGTIEVDNTGNWPFGGIWGDGACMYNRIYGNVLARLNHAGIYVEYTQNRNVIMYNTVQDCAMGITLRQASGNIVRKNWIFDSEALGVGPVDTDNLAGLGPWKTQPDHPHWGREILDGICIWHTFMDPPTADNIIMDNLVQVSGRLVSVPVPGDQDEKAMKDAARIMCLDDYRSLKEKIVVRGGGYKEAAGSYRSPLNNVLDRNDYVVKPNPERPGFAYYLDKQVDTFEEFQKLTGFEENGRVGEFSPADIGLSICWAIPDGIRYPDRPVAFDYDGGAERGAFPTGQKTARFFVDNAVQPYSWYRTTGNLIDSDYEKAVKDDPAVWTQWPACRSGIHGLGVVNTHDAAKLAAEGVGWRTISVPVKPGIVMAVSLYVKLAEVKPADKSVGAAEVCACFSDWTGHNVRREYLVGRDANRALSRGTCDWTKAEKKIKVPEGARRMIVYAGMKPATGSFLIDDLVMDTSK